MTNSIYYLGHIDAKKCFIEITVIFIRSVCGEFNQKSAQKSPFTGRHEAEKQFPIIKPMALCISRRKKGPSSHMEGCHCANRERGP